MGVKAAAQNLADVAAMGATATALLVGIATPGDLPVEWALDLMRGLAAECARAGAAVAGGDVTGAATLTLGVTALGSLGGAAPVTRGGARPGDILAVAGRLGWSAAGLALLAAGAAAADPELTAAHLRPQPPYHAGPEAARLGATSMIDISDGLIQDLGHVAAASGVSIDIDPGRPARHRAAARRGAPAGRRLAGLGAGGRRGSRAGGHVPGRDPAARGLGAPGRGPGLRGCWWAPRRAAGRAAGIIFPARRRNYRPGGPQKVRLEWLICRQLDINPLMPSHRRGNIPKHRARRPDENSGRHGRLNAAPPAKRIGPESSPDPDDSGAGPVRPGRGRVGRAPDGVAAGTRSPARSRRMRGLLVTPWFAAGAGFVIAAALSLNAPRTFLTYRPNNTPSTSKCATCVAPESVPTSKPGVQIRSVNPAVIGGTGAAARPFPFTSARSGTEASA